MVKKRRKAASTQRSDIMVMFGRFGSAPQTLRIRANGTVEDVISAAGVSVTGTDRIWLNGDRANLTDKVQDGDLVSIVSPKEAGW